MPATVTHFGQITHDLRHSNYFRVWALLWFVIFVVFWVAFGNFVAHVEQSSSIFAVGVTYPNFHFRLEGWHNATPAINVNSITCLWNHTIPLGVTTCMGYPGFSNGLANCFAVQAHNSSFSAYGRALEGSDRDHDPDGGPPPQDLFGPVHFGSFIWCNFTVNVAALGSTPNWVAWELEGLTNFAYGDNAYAPLYFAPFALSQVLLEQFTIDGTTYWDHNHIYLPMPNGINNTGAADTLYLTGVALETTTITTYQQFGLGYHSWNGLADIGGIAFSLWLMQVCVMIIVGFILENDSEFLGGHDAHHKSAAPEGPSERTNLVY